MKYTINVIDDNINKGVRKSCSACPIARAADLVFNKGAKMFEEPYEVLVTLKALHIKNNKTFKETRISLPEIAGEFIHKFDNGEIPDPISFEIEYNE